MRDYLQIGADRRMTLGLTKDADLSTFLHETGHFYLKMLGDVAEMDGVSQEVKDDYAKILKWLGVSSRLISEAVRCGQIPAGYVLDYICH